MIRVGGVTPLTTIDFPGRLAAVLFLQGCPWRCGYCHNPELLPARGRAAIGWPDVMAWLERRHGLLDGVVFSGGEPTAQGRVIEALAQVRDMGFQTAMHTGGMYPDRLRAALPLLGWVGLDVKAPENRHVAVVGRRNGHAPVERSLDIVLASGIAHECRTTWHPDLFGIGELQALGHSLLDKGVHRWVIQACRMHDRPIPADAWAGLKRWCDGHPVISLRR